MARARKKRRRPRVVPATALVRLDRDRRRALRSALRDSAPGDYVTVHADGCALATRCSCVPIALHVGATA